MPTERATAPVDSSTTEPARLELARLELARLELARLERAYAMLPWLARSTKREDELEELLVDALDLCKEMQQR
jgi:hypothetical protein